MCWGFAEKGWKSGFMDPLLMTIKKKGNMIKDRMEWDAGWYWSRSTLCGASKGMGQLVISQVKARSGSPEVQSESQGWFWNWIQRRLMSWNQQGAAHLVISSGWWSLMSMLVELLNWYFVTWPKALQFWSWDPWVRSFKFWNDTCRCIRSPGSLVPHCQTYIYSF